MFVNIPSKYDIWGMVAVLKADIVGSRHIQKPEIWLAPLKKWLRQTVGSSPQRWDIGWGDFLQLELSEPARSVWYAVALKALLKSLPLPDSKGNQGIDVRIGIGIGAKTYEAPRISESNGPAFVYAGEAFDALKPNRRMALKSAWPGLDDTLNLNFLLASVFMDSWTVAAAELVFAVLETPDIRQQDLGEQLGIRQNSVSGRWQRAHLTELLALLQGAESRIKSYLP